MKNFKMLSRTEMRNLIGGFMCPPGYVECEDGTCSIADESNCGSGGGTPGPKIIACQGKKEHDRCNWSYQGGTIYGCCNAFMASELFCTTLDTSCF